MALNAQSKKMLYQQLYDILCDEINCEVYRRGDQIPSENELCRKYNVSRVTVRNALGKMVDDGILVRRRGKGTFVATHIKVEVPTANASFSRSCVEAGATPGTRLLSSSVRWASRSVATRLGLPEGEAVLCVERLRLVDGEPAIIEVDYFPQEMDFLRRADLEHEPVLDVIFAGCGRMGHRHYDTFGVRLADERQALTLSCPPSTPLLSVCQTVYDEQDAPLYYNEQLIRTDNYTYASGS